MNQQEKYFLNLFSLLFLFTCTSHLMMSEVHKPNFKEYLSFEEAIKKINNFSSVGQVDNEIAEIKNQIYKELLTKLSDITKKPYEILEKKITHKRSRTKKSLQKKPYFFIHYHDPKMPPSMYHDLHESMLEENIYPHNVRIKYLPDTNDSPLAEASCLMPLINVYNELSKISKNDQLFTYKHELYHILLRHSYIYGIGLFYTLDLKNLTAIEEPDESEFVSICEREADIHAASTNITIALTAMEWSCTSGHSNILDNSNHCEEMTLMYELMKKKAELL